MSIHADVNTINKTQSNTNQFTNASDTTKLSLR